MNHHYRFTDVNDALPALCRHLLSEDEVGSRLGDKTKEKTFVGIRLNEPLNREILLPSRKANVAAQIAETMWVLTGRDDVAWLRNYLPRAEDFSDDGERWRGAYGPRLRAWDAGIGVVDQLAHIVKLLKEEPTTRRAVMTIYDPGRDSEPGKDIPCNNWLSFLSRNGFLDLHVAIRSNDVIWGWSGINQFEWSVLLEMVASFTGLTPGHLHFSTTSLHLYDRHYDRAEEIGRDKVLDPTRESPRFALTSVSRFDELANDWFVLEQELRTGAPVSGQELIGFPDPMLRSWLLVVAYHWTKDERYLDPLRGTRLYHAATLNKPRPAVDADPFADYVAALHAEKHAAYGDSWKARGELFSILPNIARKVDRLGTGKETADETTSDTAIDLLVYLLKYRRWLRGDFLDEVVRVGDDLHRISHVHGASSRSLIGSIRDEFDALLVDVEERVDVNQKAQRVDALINLAGPLAYRLWDKGSVDEPEERMHDVSAADRAEMRGEGWIG
jgi:thymidylate synthase